MTNFPAKLRAARTLHSLTAAQAAQRITQAGYKVGKRTYEHWEAGERTPPTEKAVITQERALAAVLGDGPNTDGQTQPPKN